MIEENNRDLLPDEIERSDEKILTVFSVNWIELEILKILNRSLEPVYKGEMISVLRTKHESIENKPESSFYAIFDKLEKLSLIQTKSIPGQGYKTFLDITAQGKVELNRALYWGISSIFEGMAGQLIGIINEFCVKSMGCLREMNFGVVSPNNPEFLVPEICNACVSSTEEDIGNRFNILMPFAKRTTVPFYQNNIATPSEIPLKSDLLDRLMSVVTLGFLSEEDALNYIGQVHRILKPESKAAFYELVEFDSYLWQALKHLTRGFQIFIPKNGSGELKQFKAEGLKSLIESVFGENSVEITILNEIIVAIAKK